MVTALAFLAAVAVVGALVVGAVALARSSRKAYVASNQVVPGRPTRAPGSWAGSHDPEAVLHRRIRDAMAALRANQAFDDDGSLLDVRVELEEQALILDDELVAVAALPRHRRHDSLAKVTMAVDAIESAVAELAVRSTVEAGPRLQEVLRRIRERTTLVDEIRSELENLPEAPQAPAPGDPAGPASDAQPWPDPPPTAPDQSGEPGQAGQTS